MAEGQAANASVRLIIDDEVYQRVKHAAVNERCSANAWIRDAVARKLEGVPEDEGLQGVAGAWASLTDEGRARLAECARVLAAVPEFRRPPEW